MLEKGQILGPAEIGLLATVGRISHVKVYKKPVIGLLSTGNELVDAATESLGEGHIRDSNKLMLKAIIEEQNLADKVVDFRIVRDVGAELDQKMQEATLECDIVVTSGGVSMGELDLVKPYIEEKGHVFFGRLNMKPGKPTTFGKMNKSLIFALPGNPVSSFVTSHLFFVRAAKILSGQLDRCDNQTIQVQLIPKTVKLDRERPEYHRVVAIQQTGSNKVYAFSTGSQLSSRLLSAKSANCLLVLPKALPASDDYVCKGSTEAILIGDMVHKSEQDLA